MLNLRSIFCIATASLIVALIIPGSAEAQASDRDALRDRIDWLLSTHEATIEGVPIAAVNLIDELYMRRDYAPAWTDAGLVRQLYDQILRSVDHGLNHLTHGSGVRDVCRDGQCLSAFRSEVVRRVGRGVRVKVVDGHKGAHFREAQGHRSPHPLPRARHQHGPSLQGI